MVLTIADDRRRVAAGVIARGALCAFLPEIRRVIDTTHALESVHARLRTIIKTCGHFPNEEAATKLMCVALQNMTASGSARGRRPGGRR
jgi:transposase-like protein